MAASTPTKTTYIDPSGKQQTGYIIDGRTYTDAAGSTTVPVGSIVNTAGGTYIKTESGSMLYSDYLASQSINKTKIEQTPAPALPSYQPQTGAVNRAYDAAGKASLAALEAAYNQNALALKASREKIPAIYQVQADTAAATAEKNRQAFNEAAAAAGLNSGAGSQARLAQDNALQSNLTAIRTAEADAIRDSENQLTALYTQYRDSVAQALAKNEYERAAALLEEYRRAADSVVSTAQNQAQLNYQYAAFDYSKSQDDYANKQTIANNLAAYGDFSGYKALGYTDEQIANMEAAWVAANPLLAYNIGKITAPEYYAMTGKMPAGYTPTSSVATVGVSENTGSGPDGNTGVNNGQNQPANTVMNRAFDPTSVLSLGSGPLSDATVQGLINNGKVTVIGQNEKGQAIVAQRFSDYSSAVSYMLQNGVNNYIVSKAMTESEWARLKASGAASVETNHYPTYSDYLTNYVAYALETR